MTKNFNEESLAMRATTRADWRAWLEANVGNATEVWLIFDRGQTALDGLTYEEAVLEGLCFGWIDSIIQRIDERSYARKFNARKDWRTWSESNRERLRLLKREGAIFHPGVLERIPSEVFDETIPGPPPPGKELSAAPEWLLTKLEAAPAAWATFQKLTPSHKRQFLGWILSASRLETQQRRAAEAVRLLEQGKNLQNK